MSFMTGLAESLTGAVNQRASEISEDRKRKKLLAEQKARQDELFKHQEILAKMRKQQEVVISSMDPDMAQALKEGRFDDAASLAMQSPAKAKQFDFFMKNVGKHRQEMEKVRAQQEFKKETKTEDQAFKEKMGETKFNQSVALKMAIPGKNPSSGGGSKRSPKTPEQIEAEAEARAAGTAKGKKRIVGDKPTKEPKTPKPRGPNLSAINATLQEYAQREALGDPLTPEEVQERDTLRKERLRLAMPETGVSAPAAPSSAPSSGPGKKKGTYGPIDDYLGK